MATCAASDGNFLVYRPVLRYDMAAVIVARDFSAKSRFSVVTSHDQLSTVRSAVRTHRRVSATGFVK